MIKVLLVEDQQLFRDGIEAIIEPIDDIEVIGTADNGVMALEYMEKDRPEVVVMDIHMPFMDGIQTTRYIKENYSDVKVVLLTTKADDDLVISGINIGADGFLVKALYADRLIECIRMAYQGQTVVSGEVARILAKRIREITLNKKQLFAMGLEKLGYNFTKREIDIAYLLMENYTNNQIASKLYLGEGTVKNYISEIYNKLNIHNRVRAVKFFQKIIPEQ
ncbi:response regulator [Oceanobacillus massiliensis]|uniref:response regulator n=1 Tax=Oceanobacillus massiliensis TaxID=1465765 RepID=UPI0002899A23|nr:response regulator transcription factor [Oceanobacillus massiliensis]